MSSFPVLFPLANFEEISKKRFLLEIVKENFFKEEFLTRLRFLSDNKGTPKVPFHWKLPSILQILPSLKFDDSINIIHLRIFQLQLTIFVFLAHSLQQTHRTFGWNPPTVWTSTKVNPSRSYASGCRIRAI